jgi:hypothetical protein
MRGGLFSSGKSKSKQKTGIERAAALAGVRFPAPPRKRKLSKRDIERKIYGSAGLLDQLPRIRQASTDLERALRASGITGRIAQNLTQKEEQELEAAIGVIAAGRTSGTLPERLVAKWLLQRGYELEGVGVPVSKGWGFQVPMLGGRDSRGGTVVDIFISPQASKTPKGVAIYPEGAYWHMKAAQFERDQIKYQKLVTMGLRVVTLWDYEAAQPGILDAKMREAVGQ